MPSSTQPGVPLSDALDRSEPLAGLLQRVQQSRERLAAVAGLLPPALRHEVRAGPLDDARWVLLVTHAAAAAKVRQLLPTIETTLAERGWSGPAIRIKVLPRG